MKQPLVGVVTALCFLSAQCLLAQPDATTGPPSDLQLVNIDTPGAPGQRVLEGRFDLRVFGAKEDTTYFGLSGAAGLGKGLALLARGETSSRKDFKLTGGGGTIRHGGSDVEVALRVVPRNTSRIAGQIGVSFDDTPAQSDAFLTLGLMADAGLGSHATLYLNPRAIFIKDNTLVGIGVGARVRIGNAAALVADWTPIVHGDNTRDTGTGERRSADVFGVALRFTQIVRNADLSFDLGFTNGVGSTTGFGLTSGLGGSGAFYLALSVRR